MILTPGCSPSSFSPRKKMVFPSLFVFHEAGAQVLLQIQVIGIRFLSMNGSWKD
jgi:hypothetical protein